MGRVEGKVAFITGAARGQGRSHAVRLGEEGADIMAVNICRQIDTVPFAMATPDDLQQTVKDVEALDRRIIAVEASNALLFLASDEARYVSGVTLPVDAGAPTK